MRTWHSIMTSDDTTTLSYWINWRFLLCAVFVLTFMVLASIVIVKYEGFNQSNRKRRENGQEAAGSLYEDETWKTSLTFIHPAWLLGFRMIAFAVLMALLVANIVIDGFGIFYFYTQWTFALVTIYFGLGSSLSMYGCFQNHKIYDGYRGDSNLDSEQGSYIPPLIGESADTCRTTTRPETSEEPHAPKIAGAGGYVFQIIYQMCAGAVLLTDSVFWILLYPFLTSEDYSLNFLIVCMHSMNAVFLLGDAFMNCLRFPMFRIAYFVLWTSIFVIFQWIIHVCVSIGWPYPFLELSSPYAPLWYVGVGLMHIPCFAVYALIIKAKHFWFSRSFSESYQSLR